MEALSPEEQLASFTVPEGFVIELVASEEHGVINPIDLTFDDAGRLWTQTGQMYPLDPISGIKWQQFLALMKDEETQRTHPEFKRIKDLYQLKTKGDDKILILDDPTRAADGPLHVWADGLAIPQSILPYQDGAYVCHGSELFFLRDTNGDGKSDKMEPVLSGFGYTDTHTMSHLLVRGPGRYVHFSQGALNQGLVTAVASGFQDRIDAACQVRFDLDHQAFEVLSAGPSNMWGLQLRANGQWYGTEANDRAYCVIPWEHGTAVTGAAFRKMRPYQPMLPELHEFRVGGTGISGLAFTEDAEGSFPFEEWKDVALLANPITSTINAVRVHRNPDGTVEAEHLPDLLSSEDDWFRPVNLEFGPDGCLYIADFYNKIVSHNEVTTDHPDRDKAHGRIWRIRHESQKARAIPNVAEATPEELLEHLQAPSLWEKRAAWYQIADRGVVALAPGLMKLAADASQDIPTRIHALWTLEDLRHYDAGLIETLLSEADHDLRRETVRSLASFDLPPAEAAALIAPFIDDEHCMVRSQAIRSLGDLRSPDPAVLAALISACKPSLGENVLGGGYERNFERFHARMALERFPEELKTYLDTSRGKHSPGNLLWAIQALDEEAKQSAFLEIWSQVKEQEMDSETFIAISGMLENPEVFEAVQPIFQTPEKAENLVGLAVANQSRVQSRQLTEMLKPLIQRLLETPETQALGLQAVSKFKVATLGPEVAAIAIPADDLETLRLLLSAQSVNPQLNAASFIKVAERESLPFDVRAEAAHALIPVDQPNASALTRSLLNGGDASQKTQLGSLFSQSKAGGRILCAMVKNQVISADVFDLSSAERIIQSFPASPEAKEILASARDRVAQQRKQAQERIHQLMGYIAENPGDPEKGKATFTSCLTCHKVGEIGQDIAPPLDGSGHRELEHLLTAIVDPDAAVEGGYGLYRITQTDGSVVEGYLDKKEALGTTVAVMGGARMFIPNASIKTEEFVGGRSFMPPAFGQLPENTLADLVAYIETLKEGEPPANSAAGRAKAAAENRAAAKPKTGKQPNIIVIFTDDQGYNDVGCFGSPLINTPHLDQMAAEGLKLTSFYAQPVCGVSRAALLTGSYPIRVGEPGNKKNLHTVLHPSEITIPEVLREAGYATGMIGKWHLAGSGRGDSWNRDLLPNAQGFDYWFGSPSHNGTTRVVPPGRGHTELMRNGEIVDPMVDQEEMGQLTKQYTEEALEFIRREKDEPFFLYLAHTMPHVPINASEAFLGKSKRGLYGDVIEELDWSVGQVLAEVKRLELDDNTLVIFTSDNGPWVEGHLEGEGGTDSHCGSADPLRGWKMSAWEGGCRVPFVARWPGKIPAGRVSDEILSTMDFLPTFARLAGVSPAADRTLDGHDASDFLFGETETSPRDTYLYYSACLLTGIREGQWRLVRPRSKNPPGTGWWGRMIDAVADYELYDLDADPGETKNVADEHPQVVERLKGLIAEAREELGDIDLAGSGARYFEEGARTLQVPLGQPQGKRAKGKGQMSAPQSQYDEFEPVGNLRFSFEEGKLDGWQITEGKFAEAVTDRPSLAKWKNQPFARHGGHHLSTLMVPDGNGVSDEQTGVLQSPPFVLEGDQVAFLVSGGFDAGKLYVALADAESGEPLIQAGGNKDHHMRRVVWDVSKWKGKTVRLQVVDRHADGWGHLNVDDFSAQGKLVLVATHSSEPDGAKAAHTGPRTKNQAPGTDARRPNFVIIFTDDQGYGDLSCYGGEHVSTPRIDQMAAEGARLTSFYVAAPVCTPSRAALMTGSYPKRVDMATGSNFGVLLAGDSKGLNPDEITIAEVLKGAGYKTGMFGKWHLGDQPEFLPTRQGFDEYFGIPFSHDIHPYHPQAKWNFPPLALLDQEEVIEMDPDADYLTKRFTEKAVDFIRENADEPFFVYLPHPIPHKPLHVSPPFMEGVDPAIIEALDKEGDRVDYKTRDKLFRQAINEIDWSVGRILDTLKEEGVDENTLVIFFSDNGPAIGSAGPLKGRKGSTFEGGMREPTVVRWPGRIPAGEDNDELMTAMDLLPTFARLAGAEVPADRVIDGKDVWPVLAGEGETPHEAFFYHGGNDLKAVRSGQWKLHWNKGKPTQLFNLEKDIGETTNLLEAEPMVAERLLGLLQDFEKDIADNSRPAAFVENPVPLKMVSKEKAPAGSHPNVVLIFADDLGYGDLGCYGATKVQTPNIDKLAAEGRRFTDAHSPSAVCTPSRYGLLTGEYPSRKGIWGPCSHTQPLLIDTEKLTLGQLFQNKGYATAAIGKWHLGFGEGKTDWNKPLRPGPLELGFDYYFGIPKVNSGFPYVYVENDSIVGYDPEDPLVFGKPPFSETTTYPEATAGRKAANRFSGAKEAHAIYDDERTGTLLTEKAVAWIEENKENPFFLYFPTPNIHHPFTPAQQFKDTSEAGLYGDFIHEFDWMVGELMRCLERNGLAENTLVIVTSDNGGMYNFGGQDAFEAGHRINGDLLGFKFGVWEGGHRVPFVARWPEKIEAGTTSNQLISGIDMLATFAALTDQAVGKKQLADSVNVLPALIADPKEALRETLVLCPNKPSHLSLRQGKWVYIPAQGGGGFTGGPGVHPGGGPKAVSAVGSRNSDIEDGKVKPDAPEAQLYDLEADVNQTTNVIREHPEVAAELKATLATYAPARFPRKKQPADQPKASGPAKAAVKEASENEKAPEGAPSGTPNVIFVLTDDLGYSDISCYGATHVKTPHIDRLAAEGIKFTDFHTAASICSPSRAAFLTGAYPQRAGLYMGINPNRRAHWFLGLHPDEITITEQFKQQGYATHMVGKWHLGTEPEFLPRKQGFDHYYGMPCNFSHSPRFFDDDEEVFAKTPLDQLTTLYTQRVTQIIKEAGTEPFFLYYSHNYPHTPFQAGEAFKGSSKDGVRGDIMQELDWGIGEMMKALDEAGIADNTIVIFTSDNGPTANKYAVPYRGTKYVTFEGGHRVPFLFHWPARIKEGSLSDVSIHAMDLFPTLSEIIGAPMPTDRVYDGESLVPLLAGGTLKRKETAPFFFYNCENLQAVRSGDWKLHLPRTQKQLPFWEKNKLFAELKEPVLYHLAEDEAEAVNVAADHPEVVGRLQTLAESTRRELGEFLQRGEGQRPTGSLFPEVPVISHEKDWGLMDPKVAAEIESERAARYPNAKNSKRKKK